MTILALIAIFIIGGSIIAYAMFRASGAADDLSDEIANGDTRKFPSIHNREQ